MSRAPALAALSLLCALALPGSLHSQDPAAIRTDSYQFEPFTEKQLDNLVAPIALYPDPLLAQVLVAATFPDQIEEAAQWVRANGTANIDEQPWDVSVKAVSHYPSALNMMADKIDWTATLGQAYAYQSTDVMIAVQRMRALAASHGNLVSTDQQQVVYENNHYVIAPSQPRVIYVPVYDPIVVYSRPIFHLGMRTRYWSFGIGFPIGVWLNYDCDWGRRAVFYHGWHHNYVHGGWRARSRPFIQVTNIYVNNRYTNVYVNRDVKYRKVDYRRVDRYARVHRDSRFEGRRGFDGGGRNVTRTAQARDRERALTPPEGYRSPTNSRVDVTRPGERDGWVTDVGRRVNPEQSAVRPAPVGRDDDGRATDRLVTPPTNTQERVQVVPRGSDRTVMPVPRNTDRAVTPVPRSSDRTVRPVPELKVDIGSPRSRPTETRPFVPQRRVEPRMVEPRTQERRVEPPRGVQERRVQPRTNEPQVQPRGVEPQRTVQPRPQNRRVQPTRTVQPRLIERRVERSAPTRVERSSGASVRRVEPSRVQPQRSGGATVGRRWN